MKRILKWLILVLIGGGQYFAIELLVRSKSHWSMVLVGGSCFLLIGMLNEIIPWEMSLILQAVLGTIVTTLVEFISGIILNIHLKWNIWDYSNMPFNVLGQICLPFTFIWFFLSLLAIVQDDYLRYWLFKEEKPHYRLFGGKRI